MNDLVKKDLKSCEEDVANKNLKIMSQEEAEQYLALIATGDGPILTGMETIIEEKFQECIQNLKTVVVEAEECKKRIKEYADLVQKLNGEINIYSRLLVSAEDARRCPSPVDK